MVRNPSERAASGSDRLDGADAIVAPCVLERCHRHRRSGRSEQLSGTRCDRLSGTLGVGRCGRLVPFAVVDDRAGRHAVADDERRAAQLSLEGAVVERTPSGVQVAVDEGERAVDPAGETGPRAAGETGSGGCDIGDQFVRRPLVERSVQHLRPPGHGLVSRAAEIPHRLVVQPHPLHGAHLVTLVERLDALESGQSGSAANMVDRKHAKPSLDGLVTSRREHPATVRRDEPLEFDTVVGGDQVLNGSIDVAVPFPVVGCTQVDLVPSL